MMYSNLKANPLQRNSEQGTGTPIGCSKVPKGTLPLGGWEGLDLPSPINVEGTPPYCPSLSILVSCGL